MLWRLYVYGTLLARLAQDLDDMAAALGPCIQEKHAVAGQRHLARQRHVAPINPRVGMGKWAADKASIDPAWVRCSGQLPCILLIVIDSPHCSFVALA
jgi:hypothetical protein